MPIWPMDAPSLPTTILRTACVCTSSVCSTLALPSLNSVQLTCLNEMVYGSSSCRRSNRAPWVAASAWATGPLSAARLGGRGHGTGCAQASSCFTSAPQPWCLSDDTAYIASNACMGARSLSRPRRRESRLPAGRSASVLFSTSTERGAARDAPPMTGGIRCSAALEMSSATRGSGSSTCLCASTRKSATSASAAACQADFTRVAWAIPCQLTCDTTPACPASCRVRRCTALSRRNDGRPTPRAWRVVQHELGVPKSGRPQRLHSRRVRLLRHRRHLARSGWLSELCALCTQAPPGAAPAAQPACLSTCSSPSWAPR